MKIILIFGAPGAGKGTQSSKIIEKYGYLHISTGNILREAIKNKTSLGIEASKYMENGNLVPDEVVTNLIKEVIKTNSNASGFVFDGFPRTTEQAKSLDTMLENDGLKVNIMLALQVDEEELKARLNNRAKEENRTDDTPEIIENRIKTYTAKTAPVADYYKKQNKLVEINGIGEVDEIFKEIINAIETK